MVKGIGETDSADSGEDRHRQGEREKKNDTRKYRSKEVEPERVERRESTSLDKREG